MRYRLSVDFGTTNTAAAIQVGSSEPRPVRLGTRSDSIPSAVTSFQGKLLVGDEALRLRLIDPTAHEPSPKRRLDAPSIVLAGQQIAPTTLVSAVLAEVLRMTRVHTNGDLPEQTVLTHPQAWQRPRQELLYTAALQAGFPPGTIALASEPVSAAWYYAVRTTIGVNDRIAVVDFGGGTFDVAVLSFGNGRNGRRGFSVLATDGIDPLGGQDFDAVLADWVLSQLEMQGRADLLDRLRSPEGLAARLNLRDQVREAKHALSESQSSPVLVNVGDTSTTVMATAQEFEALIRPDVAHAVQMTAETISAADPQGRSRPDSLQRMFLTGGSSLIPLVHGELNRLTQGKVARIDDPKQVTSLGALSCPDLAPFNPKVFTTDVSGGGARTDRIGDDRPPEHIEATSRQTSDGPGGGGTGGNGTGGNGTGGKGAGGNGGPGGSGTGGNGGPGGRETVRRTRKSKVGVWVGAGAGLLVLTLALVVFLTGESGGGVTTPSTGTTTTAPDPGPTTTAPDPGPTTTPPEDPGGTVDLGECQPELASADCATVKKAGAVVTVNTCSYDPPGSQQVSCYPADRDTVDADATVFVYSRTSVANLKTLADERFSVFPISGTVGTDRDEPPAKARYTYKSGGGGLIYTLESDEGQAVVIWTDEEDLHLYVITSSNETVAELLDWWENH